MHMCMLQCMLYIAVTFPLHMFEHQRCANCPLHCVLHAVSGMFIAHCLLLRVHCNIVFLPRPQHFRVSRIRHLLLSFPFIAQFMLHCLATHCLLCTCIALDATNPYSHLVVSLHLPHPAMQVCEYKSDHIHRMCTSAGALSISSAQAFYLQYEL